MLALLKMHILSKRVDFQAALARMSNMFMGTLTIKGPKTSTAIGMSLEEMDRPVSILLMKIMMVKTNDDDGVHAVHDVNDVVDNKDEDGDDNDNDGDVGALPRKHRPVLMGGDVQAEEGEDQDGGGPAQPRQGGRRGRGDPLLLLSLFLHFSQVIVEQRGESHAIVEKKIAELKAGLQQFHKTKIDLINNRWWEEKPKDNPFCSQLFFFIISLQSGRCN